MAENRPSCAKEEVLVDSKRETRGKGVATDGLAGTNMKVLPAELTG